MQIHESCHNWELDYKNPSLKVVNEDSNEFKILKSILHLAGDIIDAYNNLPPEVDSEIRDMVLGSFSAFLLETKDNILNVIDTAVSAQALKDPLQDEYSEDKIFGIKVIDEFKTILTEPEELSIAAEHLHTLLPSGEEERDDDGNTEIN
jgi:hypothetical protein